MLGKAKEDDKGKGDEKDDDGDSSEDDGFLVRQLVINLEDLVQNAAKAAAGAPQKRKSRMSVTEIDTQQLAANRATIAAGENAQPVRRRSNKRMTVMGFEKLDNPLLRDDAPPAPPKKHPADALLDCIDKVRAITASRRMQEKLQDFVMEWLRPPKLPVVREEPDLRMHVAERRRFWAPYRANVHKWEETDTNMARMMPANGAASWFSQFGMMEKRAGTPSTRVPTASTRPNTGASSRGVEDAFASQPSSRVSSAPSGKKRPKVGDWRKATDRPSSQPSNMHCTLRSFRKSRPTINDLGKSLERSFTLGLKDSNSPSEASSSRPSSQGQSSNKELTRPPIRPAALYPAPATTLRQKDLWAVRSLPALTTDDPWQSPGQSRSPSPPESREGSPRLRDTEAFPEMFDLQDCAPLAATPLRDYFRACQDQSLLPRVPPFLVQDEWNQIDLRSHQLLDRDLTALLAPLRSVQKVERLDLSYNKLGDSSVKKLVTMLRTACRDMSALDISRSGAADLAMREVAQCIKSEWRRLKILQMGGIALSDSTWQFLCDALALSASQLRELCLPEAQLGRMNQRDAVRVGTLIRELPKLERLDVSGNFFFAEGFIALSESLAESMCLTELDISHNASSHLVPAKKNKQRPVNPKKPHEVLYDEVPNFNPVLLFLEGLDRNRTLKDLRMASAQIDLSADFVLFQAASSHPQLESLDLSHNPHGDDGLRALLRLTMPATSKIVYCDISGTRDGLAQGLSMRFDFSEPSGKYELDFQHPQHRCILRELLSRAEAQGPEVLQKVFRQERFHPGPFSKNMKQWYWKSVENTVEGEIVRWEFPADGHISFNYHLPNVQLDQQDKDAAVRAWYRSHRIPISMGRFVTLYSMFEGLTDARQKALLISAMRDQLLLKFCHLKKLMSGCPELAEFTVRQLFPAVEKMDRMVLFDILKQPDAARRLRKEARTQFFFNPHNPTDSYELDVANPSDRAVGERLYIINVYEAALILEGDIPDTSQWGNGEGARNVRWNRHQEIKKFSKFSIPFEGQLKLDYVSPIAASKKVKNITDDVVESLIEALGESECCHDDKVKVVRGVSHCIVLAPEQVSRICDFCPNPALYTRDTKKTAAQKLQAVKSRITAMKMLGMKLKTSAFQLSGGNPRQDMFVTLFNRCNRVPGLVTAICLYDQKLFTHNCAHLLRERLGYLRTWDVLGCCNPDVNLGNRYVLNLKKHEHWVAAKLLVEIATHEPGENLTSCQWSERGFLAEQGYDFLVPAEWTRDLPQVGTFSVTYRSENPSCIRLPEREWCGVCFCGWER
eukprot:gnl/MRDRNA2_/MRDRNA2_33167_c0_seq1.p1 gnl/MRDRNA2_/MRDRNA2_33167_c0~~gnl/MRDRNA2_/MRDRNA2_33167_c0_seq1.p1  ORF type:complete len:1298 (+),score=198.26 gnl/MRDRNA2_/MRDRNA2_33167_c0_seq1:115-4008(+)